MATVCKLCQEGFLPDWQYREESWGGVAEGGGEAKKISKEIWCYPVGGCDGIKNGEGQNSILGVRWGRVRVFFRGVFGRTAGSLRVEEGEKGATS